jgi:hypothetical protein
MTPEEALRNILKLVEGSDELEDTHAMQVLLQSIKTLAEKGWGALHDGRKFHVRAVRGGKTKLPQPELPFIFVGGRSMVIMPP